MQNLPKEGTTEQTLVVTIGNDPQLPFFLRFFERLRAEEFGAFSGPLLLVSDRLSDRSLRALDRIGIDIHLFGRVEVSAWKEVIESDKHPLGKIAKPFFVRRVIETCGRQASKLLYLDPDILIQKPIQSVLDRIEDGRVLMSVQQEPMLERPGPDSLRRAIEKGDVPESILTALESEISTGLLGGRMEPLKEYLSRFIEFMISSPFLSYRLSDPGRNNAWHDQDYFRCFVRLRGTADLTFLSQNDIIHLCGGAHELVYAEQDPPSVRVKATGVRPTLVHLAGGSLIHFKELERYYYGFSRP